MKRFLLTMVWLTMGFVLCGWLWAVAGSEKSGHGAGRYK